MTNLLHVVLQYVKRLSKLGLVSFITWFLWYGYNKRKQERKLLKFCPPGSLGYWFLGESLELLMGTREFDLKRKEIFGLNYTTHLFGSPVVRVGTLQDRQYLLRSETLGETRQRLPDHVMELFGKGSLGIVTGDRHIFLRKFFHVALSTLSVQSYQGIVDECMRDTLKNFCDGNLHCNSEYKAMTLKILTSTAFGGHITSEEGKMLGQLFKQWSQGIITLFPFDLPFTTYRNALRARAKLIEFIKTKTKTFNPSPTDHDLLSRLVLANRQTTETISEEEMCDSMLTLLFAGHDTTFASLSSLTAILFNPNSRHWLDRLRTEMQKVENLEDLRTHPYLNAVIDETLRLLPPASAVTRETLVDITLSDGYKVPTGVSISAYMMAGHLNEEVWENPTTFNPDRFIQIRDENREVIRPNYYPFAAGTRACLGEQLARLEMRIFLYHVARGYRFEVFQKGYEQLPVLHTKFDFKLRSLQEV
jgi:cytochrome P450